MGTIGDIYLHEPSNRREFEDAYFEFAKVCTDTNLGSPFSTDALRILDKLKSRRQDFA